MTTAPASMGASDPELTSTCPQPHAKPRMSARCSRRYPVHHCHGENQWPDPVPRQGLNLAALPPHFSPSRWVERSSLAEPIAYSIPHPGAMKGDGRKPDDPPDRGRCQADCSACRWSSRREHRSSTTYSNRYDTPIFQSRKLFEKQNEIDFSRAYHHGGDRESPVRPVHVLILTPAVIRHTGPSRGARSFRARRRRGVHAARDMSIPLHFVKQPRSQRYAARPLQVSGVRACPFPFPSPSKRGMRRAPMTLVPSGP